VLHTLLLSLALLVATGLPATPAHRLAPGAGAVPDAAGRVPKPGGGVLFEQGGPVSLRHAVLGTGINPGFVLDALIVMWSSICLRVDSIEASRVNDLSPFGPTVMVGQGVGTTVEQFEKGVADGSIVGHIGFPESIELIAKALNWKIDEIVETREPIVTEVERSTPHVHVPAGWVAGCKQVGKGYSNGELKIHLIHPQQIHPEMADQDTGDYIKITGDPNVNMVNSPEIPGGKGTYASTGNYIPLMKDAKPGMLTVVDMPLPRFWTPTA